MGAGEQVGGVTAPLAGGGPAPPRLATPSSGLGLTQPSGPTLSHSLLPPEY